MFHTVPPILLVLKIANVFPTAYRSNIARTAIGQRGNLFGSRNCKANWLHVSTAGDMCRYMYTRGGKSYPRLCVCHPRGTLTLL